MMIEDYKIIAGFPEYVESKVKSLLSDDWQPHGVMYKMKAPDGNNDIVTQCMVLHKQ